MMYKTLQRKLQIEHHKTPGVNSGALEREVVPAALVAPVVLLLSGMNIM